MTDNDDTDTVDLAESDAVNENGVLKMASLSWCGSTDSVDHADPDEE